MALIEDIESLPPSNIENVEKLTLRWMFQATLDYGIEAFDVFYQSPDDVKEVAEDITREILDRMSGYNVPQRVFGTVDYKKARYIILPEEMMRQALFVDAKAEKESRSATLQMSQTSMRVRHVRKGKEIDKPGFLPPVSLYDGKQYLSTTAFLHFRYRDEDGAHILEEVTLFVVPNGKVQDKYNPTASDSFWLAGRDSPKCKEDFRVRVSFSRLKAKASWRVQRISYDQSQHKCSGEWQD